MTPNNKEEQQRPAFTATPEPPTLLDKIIAENRIEQRDMLILKRAELDYKQRLAKMFASAGCFADVDRNDKGEWFPEDVSIARAMIKIELGESMGFSPAEAMSGIDIIKGRPAIGAHLRAARMQRAGFSWPQMTCTDEGCWMPLEFQGQAMMQQKVDPSGAPIIKDGKPVMVQVVVSYTRSDATSAGLIGKDNYKKNPSDMYFARCVTRAQRRYGPHVLGAEILDTYEAREAAAQDSDPSQGAQAATERKTEALAEKIRTKKEEKVTPAPAAVTAPSAVTIEADAKWQKRVMDTFLDELGVPEFSAVLHSVTGDAGTASITSVNHEAVWKAMTAAKGRAKGAKDLPETKAAAPGDLF